MYLKEIRKITDAKIIAHKIQDLGLLELADILVKRTEEKYSPIILT